MAESPAEQLEIRYVPLDEAVRWDRNPKRHDLRLLIALFQRHGFRDPAIFDRTLQAVPAGNGRLEALALMRTEKMEPPRGVIVRPDGMWLVPITFGVDAATPEAAEAFGVDHNQAGFGGSGIPLRTQVEVWNPPELTALLDELKSAGEPPLSLGGEDGLEKLLEQLHREAAPAEAEEPDRSVNLVRADESIFALREDVIFASTNSWGLPELRADRLSSIVPEHVWGGGQLKTPAEQTLFVYGTHAPPPQARGAVLGFYVDDVKFEVVWRDAVRIAEKFLSFGWGALVTPDFSVWRDDPLPVQLWAIYRSRWVARYWQESGFNVIPNLGWSDERSYDFAFTGIPEGVPVAMVQCRTTKSRRGREFFIRGIAEGISRVKPQTVVVYGGLEHRDWIAPHLPADPRYVWLDSWTALRRTLGRGKESAS